LCGKYVCPRCGRETEFLIEGLCPKCYAEVKGPELIPNVIEAEVCKYCGAVKLGFRWIESEGSFESIIMKVIEHEVKKVAGKNSVISNIELKSIIFETEPNWTTRLVLVLTGVVRNEKVEWKKPITVKLNPSICPKCIVRISGEYDTVVQLRGFKPGILERDVMNLIEKSVIFNDLIDIIRHKEGVDVYFSHIGAARKFIKIILKKYEASWKGPYREVIGTNSSGKSRTRNTFVVRILTKR